ncbi:glycosyltransferase family 25 protein [Rhizobium sp. CG4]|uniref:glycosyltransferase family 25 protein n=1 Tax=Rhizobium sp. CG4 TaxID=2726075 RepID=UPI0020334A7E|nr:glycosyltransferase family 25 protein [Rhizobium sp. CG4]MCM2458020.1 glycosyltransferase family 25 protein [Rhizobium sp. CG4]
MDICIFAINLDRSVDRWERLKGQLESLGLPAVRVSGVDGTTIAMNDRVDCNTRSFERNNGRSILPGEYGCYRSHLKALSEVHLSGKQVAVIIEDDLDVTRDLIARAQSAVEAVPNADVIKFFSHRVVGFRRVATSKAGDDVGRASHGPLGSAACYVVTRRGAEKLAKTLKVMEYPIDIALERGWDSGAQVYTTRSNVAVPIRGTTTIATRAIYKRSKFPWWKRFRTYGIRIAEAAHRIRYARLG